MIFFLTLQIFMNKFVNDELRNSEFINSEKKKFRIILVTD